MDPTSALRTILDTDSDYSSEDVQEIAEGLLTWLGNGGFAPTLEGLTQAQRHELLRLAALGKLAEEKYGIGLV